jgi:hypothetical protein
MTPKVVSPKIRRLKVEEVGTRYRWPKKPRIRIEGYWLERAGFRPDSHVQVTCVAPGVIELRSSDVLVQERKTSSEERQGEESLGLG